MVKKKNKIKSKQVVFSWTNFPRKKFPEKKGKFPRNELQKTNN